MISVIKGIKRRLRGRVLVESQTKAEKNRLLEREHELAQQRALDIENNRIDPRTGRRLPTNQEQGIHMKFEVREFSEDAFRFMEVQICEETKTVQFTTFDHGGDHPTSPSVALDWGTARRLADWIRSTIPAGG